MATAVVHGGGGCVGCCRRRKRYLFRIAITIHQCSDRESCIHYELWIEFIESGRLSGTSADAVHPYKA